MPIQAAHTAKNCFFFRSQEGVSSARVPCYAQKKAYQRPAYKGALAHPKKALRGFCKKAQQY